MERPRKRGLEEVVGKESTVRGEHGGESLRRNKRSKNRHKFKTFGERIAEVRVSEYRRKAAWRTGTGTVGCDANSEDLNGETHTSAALEEWRELCTAEHFISLYQVLSPLVKSAPLLVHYRARIMAAILERLTMKALLSLQGIMAILCAVFRDLRGELFDFFRPLCATVTKLVVEEGCGREPEALEWVLGGLGACCKWLSRQLVTDVPMLIDATFALRSAPKMEHVRRITCQAVGFILIQPVARDELALTINALTDQVCADDANIDSAIEGAGFLIAHAILAPKERLHSSATHMLRILLAMEARAADNEVMVFWKIAQTAWKETFGHVNFESSGQMWDLLLESLKTVQAEEVAKLDTLKLAALLHIVTNGAVARGGKLLKNRTEVLSALTEVIGYISKHLGDGAQRLLVEEMLAAVNGTLSSRAYSNEDVSSAFKSVIPRVEGALLYDLSYCILVSAAENQELLFSLSPPIVYALEQRAKVVMGELGSEEEKLKNFVNVDMNGTKDLWSEMCEIIKIVSRLAIQDPHRLSLESRRNLGKIIKCSLKAIESVSDLPGSDTDEAQYSVNQDVTYSSAKLLAFTDASPSFIMDLTRDLTDVESTRTPYNVLLRAALQLSYITSCVKHDAKDQLTEFVTSMMETSTRTSLDASTLEILATGLELCRQNIPGSIDLSLGELVGRLPQLTDSLKSSNQSVRLNALRFILQYQDSFVGHQRETVQDFIFFTQWRDSVELCQLGPHSSRSAEVVIASVKTHVQNDSFPDALASAVFSCLIGGLAVPYSLLWPLISDGLATLLRAYPKKLWKIYFKELRRRQTSCMQSWAKTNASDSLLEGDDTTTEAAYTKLSYAKVESSTYSSAKATDEVTILSQLIKVLELCPEYFSLHDGVVTQLVFEFAAAPPDNNDFYRGSPSAENAIVDYELNIQAPQGSKAWRKCLGSWMRSLSAIRRPSKLKDSEKVKDLASRYLASADEDIQSVSLRLLQSFRLPYLEPYGDVVQKLIDSASIRAMMTRFPIHKIDVIKDSGTSINALDGIRLEHRKDLIPLLIRLLWPKMRKRNGRLQKKGASGSARAAILIYLSTLETEELYPLFSLILEPMLSQTTSLGNDGKSLIRLLPLIGAKSGKKEIYHTKACTSNVPHKIRVGFLNTVSDVLGKMANHFLHYIDIFLILTVSCLKDATSDASASYSDEENREVRVIALDIFTVLFGRFPSMEFDFIWPIFVEAVRPIYANLWKESLSLDNPPALLRCIVSAASSKSLVVRLCDSIEGKSGSLLDSILPIIGQADYSSPSRNLVLDMLTKIYETKEANMIESILKPNAEKIVAQIDTFMKRVSKTEISDDVDGEDDKIKKNKKSSPGLMNTKKELNLLLLVSEFVQNKGLVVASFRFLLPTIATIAKSCRGGGFRLQGFLRDSLSSIQVLLSRCRDDLEEDPDLHTDICPVAHELINALGPLFGVDCQRQLRLVLIEAYSEAAEYCGADYIYAAKILKDLNAYSKTELEGFDYDTRLNAAKEISGRLLELPMPLVTAVMLQLLSFLKIQDMALQNSAAQSIYCIIDMVKASGSLSDVTSWVHGIIFAQAKSGIRKSIPLPIRQEHLALLRHLALTFPVRHPELVVLCEEDSESDFFRNVCHLQMHRRSRALQRLSRLCMEGKIKSNSTMSEFVCPLILAIVHDMLVKEGKQQSQIDKEASLADSLVSSLGGIAGALAWTQYYSFLAQFVKLLLQSEEPSKLVIRCVCTVLEAFSFDLSGNESAISVAMREKVLIPLQNHMTVNTEVLRAPIAPAVIKTLILLPEKEMQLHLPRTLHGLANLLKSRQQNVRDTARNVLCSVSIDLGAKYFSLVLEALRTQLSQGHQLNVLGYTTHAILEKIVPHAQRGAIDECLSSLIEVFEEDLFSATAERRNVEKIASTSKEAKLSRANSCFQLLASHLNFPDSISELLQPILGRLDTTSSSTRRLLESLFISVARGVVKNETTSSQSLFEYVQATLCQGLEIKAGTSDQPLRQNVSDKTAEKEAKVAKFGGGDLVLQFALDILRLGLNSGAIEIRDIESNCMSELQMQLHSCLFSTRTAVTISAMKCIGLVMRDASYAKDDRFLEQICSRSVQFIYSYGKTAPSTLLVTESTKVLASALEYSEISLTTRDLKKLISHAFLDLNNAMTSGSSFALLRVLLSRRIDVPELRVLLEDKISRILVVSHETQVQRMCSKILLQYLLDFPVGSAGIERLLIYFVQNLDYELPLGRIAVLNTLVQIASKVPSAFLDLYASNIFMPVSRTLVVDRDTECRKEAAECLKHLLGRSDSSTREKLIGYMITWHTGDNYLLRRTAAQLFGIGIELIFKAFQKHAKIVIQTIFKCVKGAAEDMNKIAEDDVGVVSGWEELYYNIILLEKLFALSNDIASDYGKKAVNQLGSCMGHRHLWVKKVITRLLLTVFVKDSKNAMAPIWTEKATSIAYSLSLQVEHCIEDNALGNDSVSFLSKLFASNLVEESAKLKIAAKLKKALSSSTSDRQATTILTWIASVSQVTKESSPDLHIELIDGAIRGTQKTNTSQEVKELAGEVLQLISDAVGKESFASMFSQVQRRIQEKREGRREAKQAIYIQHPELQAKHKLKRSQKRTASRKRKIEDEKRKRGAIRKITSEN